MVTEEASIDITQQWFQPIMPQPDKPVMPTERERKTPNQKNCHPKRWPFL